MLAPANMDVKDLWWQSGLCILLPSEHSHSRCATYVRSAITCKVLLSKLTKLLHVQPVSSAHAVRVQRMWLHSLLLTTNFQVCGYITYCFMLLLYVQVSPLLPALHSLY